MLPLKHPGSQDPKLAAVGDCPPEGGSPFQKHSTTPCPLGHLDLVASMREGTKINRTVCQALPPVELHPLAGPHPEIEWQKFNYRDWKALEFPVNLPWGVIPF